ERINDSDFTIVNQYQSELRGYYQYYQMATNVSNLYKVKWVMETSLTKTLAAKHKASVMDIVRKYKTCIKTPSGVLKCIKVEIPRPDKDPLIAMFGGIPLRRNTKAEIQDKVLHTMANRGGHSELLQRLLAEECEACGASTGIEVHHIRALKDLIIRGRKEK